MDGDQDVRRYRYRSSNKFEPPLTNVAYLRCPLQMKAVSFSIKERKKKEPFQVYDSFAIGISLLTQQL